MFTRYPGIAPSIRREEYEGALAVFASLTNAFGLRAGEVVRWVEELLGQENEAETENRTS